MIYMRVSVTNKKNKIKIGMCIIPCQERFAWLFVLSFRFYEGGALCI